MVIERLARKIRLSRIRRAGAQIPDDCRIGGLRSWPSFGSEPYLISIGHRVGIAAKVTFITHDGGTWVFRRQPGFEDVIKYGRITIHDDSIIGYGAILLPGDRDRAELRGGGRRGRRQVRPAEHAGRRSSGTGVHDGRRIREAGAREYARRWTAPPTVGTSGRSCSESSRAHGERCPASHHRAGRLESGDDDPTGRDAAPPRLRAVGPRRRRPTGPGLRPGSLLVCRGRAAGRGGWRSSCGNAACSAATGSRCSSTTASSSWPGCWPR